MFIDDLMRLDKSLVEVCDADHNSQFPAFLDGNRPIRLVGMGASYNICVAAAPIFKRYGLSAQANLASDLLHFGLSAIRDDEVFVLVSQGGESAETVKVAQLLKERGHPYVLAVTNRKDSSLAVLSTAVCQLHSPVDALVSLATYNSTYIVLYKMALKLANVPFPDLSSTFAEASRLVANGMQTARRIVDKIPSPFMIDLLGRGPLFGSALEACVIFREVSKLPASAWDVGEYRHGAMESIHPQQLTILFTGAADRVQDLDLSFAARLKQIPGEVIVIGTAENADIPIRTADEDMRPILDLIPVYFMAYLWALDRGITPGTFLWAAHVTNAES